MNEQEFLEYLTDPVKAGLKQACKEFHKSHKTSIVNVLFTESKNVEGEYVASIVADNNDILFNTRDEFINFYIRGRLPNVLINITTIEEQGGLYLRHYIVKTQ